MRIAHYYLPVYLDNRVAMFFKSTFEGFSFYFRLDLRLFSQTQILFFVAREP
jgi:hypothetical protein